MGEAGTGGAAAALMVVAAAAAAAHVREFVVVGRRASVSCTTDGGVRVSAAPRDVCVCV